VNYFHMLSFWWWEDTTGPKGPTACFISEQHPLLLMSSAVGTNNPLLYILHGNNTVYNFMEYYFLLLHFTSLHLDKMLCFTRNQTCSILRGSCHLNWMQCCNVPVSGCNTTICFNRTVIYTKRTNSQMYLKENKCESCIPIWSTHIL